MESQLGGVVLHGEPGMAVVDSNAQDSGSPVISFEEAQAAVRVLLQYAGDNPGREGLVDTPERVAKAFSEWFCGYKEDPRIHLERTFADSAGYDEIILLRNIRFESHCEHHMVPIVGVAHIGYLPSDRVVGISKLARVVHGYSKRLQIQEKLTAQIAAAIQGSLSPRGVAVMVDAEHLCMTTRGVQQQGVTMGTSALRGVFRDDASAREEVFSLLQGQK